MWEGLQVQCFPLSRDEASARAKRRASGPKALPQERMAMRMRGQARRHWRRPARIAHAGPINRHRTRYRRCSPPMSALAPMPASAPIRSRYRDVSPSC
ncbi:hypothetical protein [Lysobacter gummosus]|uniref:hypothetical protein n=1 Tax=Lysobacter gummosus TaxID=262324 RepID=UPI00362AFCB0